MFIDGITTFKVKREVLYVTFEYASKSTKQLFHGQQYVPFYPLDRARGLYASVRSSRCGVLVSSAGRSSAPLY